RVLHNWDDENCVRILKRCKEAISNSRGENKRRGKVIVIDMVVGNEEVMKKKERHQVQLCFDMLMMALVNGKERDEEEWERLFLTVGFSDYKIVCALDHSKQMEGLLENITGDELLKAQAHVWSYSFNYIVSMSLKCAVEIGIPDAVHRHGRPISLSGLVASLKLHHSKTDPLRRLMRLLSHAGFFTTSDDGQQELGKLSHYTLTTASKLLLNGAAAKPFLLMQTDPNTMTSWGMLSMWFMFSDSPVPYEAASGGVSFWECMEKNPKQKKGFYDAMVGDSELVAGVLVRECREIFDGVETFVDVGGGTGALSVAIAKAFPDVKCTVFDLPHVVEGLKGGAGVGNLGVVGGSMFEDRIPAADVVILKWILHNWDDEKCVKILKSCREAVSHNIKGKVIIIDMVVGNKAVANDHEMSQVQLCFDLLMMASYNAKERTEEEWKSLFEAAGFSDYKVVRCLGARSVIEAYP
ncbi:Probable O-methyltransferase 3, partial [Linum perenne]